MMIEVCSNFQYNPASLTEVKSRQLGDIYKMRQKLKSLIEWADFEVYDSDHYVLNYKGLIRWLKYAKGEDGKSLESKLEGGSFEKHIKYQEEFYQKTYGPDFKLDIDNIVVDKSRLKAIKKGLENRFANYPLIVVTPDVLDEKETKITEAEFVYRKFLYPFEFNMNFEEGFVVLVEGNQEDNRAEFFKNCSNIDLKALLGGPDNYAKELKRALEESPALVKPKKIELVFTDSRSQIPAEQSAVNSLGAEVRREKGNFWDMTYNEVTALTPEQWMILAAQVYVKDKTILSKDQNNWLSAVRKDKRSATWAEFRRPFIFAGFHETAGETVSDLYFDSEESRGRPDEIRWRSAL